MNKGSPEASNEIKKSIYKKPYTLWLNVRVWLVIKDKGANKISLHLHWFQQWPFWLSNLQKNHIPANVNHLYTSVSPTLVCLLIASMMNGRHLFLSSISGFFPPHQENWYLLLAQTDSFCMYFTHLRPSKIIFTFAYMLLYMNL